MDFISLGNLIIEKIKIGDTVGIEEMGGAGTYSKADIRAYF
jgi:hypothetical protein